MQAALDAVIDLLDLEPIEVNIFRGLSPEEDRQRTFGGQVAGQALVAAARTVEDVAVHSLHSYFLRPGDPAAPILYEVDRIRDGRSFTTRRVVAIQHGRPIFNLAASFQRHEDGLDHQATMPEVPDPESLPTITEQLKDYPGIDQAWLDRPRSIDMRYVSGAPLARTEEDAAMQQQFVWMRANGVLPDDQLLHTCLLTYASDMTLLDTSLVPHGISSMSGKIMMASLDHAMWFHRPFRADEWLLYAQDTPSASGARGLARGLVYQHDGTLVASVMQEGLIRRITK
ncbi:MAG: acyl-CoA thioesterase II [Acidimicrobiales bacterium]|nr:acyl-CoA thioesterase II [Acidimicrobiales bacterium]